MLKQFTFPPWTWKKFGHVVGLQTLILLVCNFMQRTWREHWLWCLPAKKICILIKTMSWMNTTTQKFIKCKIHCRFIVQFFMYIRMKFQYYISIKCAVDRALRNISNVSGVVARETNTHVGVSIFSELEKKVI